MAKNDGLNLDVSILSVGFDISGGTTKRKLSITGSGDTALIAQQTIDLTLPNRASDTLIGAKDFTAKGDLLAGTAAAAFSNLSVGADKKYLSADSSQSTGLTYSTVSTNITNSSNYNRSFDDFTRVQVQAANGFVSPYYFGYFGSGSRINPEPAGAGTDFQHPGIIKFHTTSATAYNLICNRQNTTFGKGELSVEMMVYFSALSTATQRYAVRLGYGDQTTNTSTESNNGAYFVYSDNINSGKWQIKTGNGGSYTTADTGTTVAATTWYKLKIVGAADGSNVRFYINGSEVSGSPLNTNIPTTNAFGVLLIRANSVGTTPGDLWVDYIDNIINLTASRQ